MAMPSTLDISTTNVRLGVLGWPVAHSRSPAMQNAALAAVGLGDWRYQLLPMAPERFGETVRALPALGFRGVNVTIPHKQSALALADTATSSARAIGAANTLTFAPNGSIAAENTDAPALIAALPFPVRGRDALVLGAGGSARAAVWALLDAGAAEVRVWNRTPLRAEALCGEIGGTPVSRVDGADLLVNCTSLGMDGSGDVLKEVGLDADQIDAYRCVVDFVYRDAGTSLMVVAETHGISTVDGLQLLVGQGALSFERFTGRAAPLDVMRAAVKR
jgi:shikimate dehydrogenase